MPRVRLAWLLGAFCAGSVVLLTAATLPFLLQVSRQVSQRQSAEVLRGQAYDAGAQLTRGLYAQWFKLQQLAPLIAKDEPAPVLRLRLDTIKLVDPDCAWIGVADEGGRIRLASNGVLEGESVLQRSWFRVGTQRPFAGDVHGALMLARFLSAPSDEPVRLVDLSLPIHRGDGTLAGVVAMHVDWSWVRGLIRSFGGENGVDLLLISRDGDVLVGPRDLEGKRLGLHSVVAAGQGVESTGTETWPDGKPYLVTALPIAGYRDLPGFGWSVLARQPADLAFTAARQTTLQVLPALLVTGIVLIAAALLLGRAIAAPVARLALAAGDIARHRFDAPVPDERRYREAALLSAALARLQSTAASEETKPSVTEGAVAA